MTAGRSSLGLIFTTVTIDLIGFGIVIPVLPLYAERFGASPTVVGLLMAVYSVMQFVFAPILGRVSDRVGRRPVLLVSIIGTSLGFLLMGLAHTLWLLFIARMIDGITGGNISTAQAYIADVTPPEERSAGMGWIGAAFGVGFVFGPAIGGVMSHFSLAAPFLCAAALAAANAVALYFLLPESLPVEHRHSPRRASIIRVFEEAGNWQLATVTVTYFVATIAFAILTATFALFTHLSVHFSYDATRNGYLFAYLGALGAMIQGGLLGRFVRTVGDKALAVAGTAVMAASLFVLPMSTTLGKLLVVITGIAIGNSLVTPTLNGIASRSVNAAWQGRVFGVMQSGASLARIIGPAVGGWLLDRDVHDHTTLFGKTPYWTGAVIMLVASCLALTIQTRHHE